MSVPFPSDDTFSSEHPASAQSDEPQQRKPQKPQKLVTLHQGGITFSVPKGLLPSDTDSEQRLAMKKKKLHSIQAQAKRQMEDEEIQKTASNWKNFQSKMEKKAGKKQKKRNDFDTHSDVSRKPARKD
ncbi:hypothetical protein BLNAU_5696 [Blattamonas nauphoetae]|uniref:Uncharacterized protein n=1 Tax=Blattamonas nauphoetae TaxID=2049346 RepID=A0ABQ9Y6J7_9EUKA|nr:hypothetical protein BLNAU_5696 [Blattamonas nauphoetae]